MMNRTQKKPEYLEPKARVFNVLTERSFCNSIKNVSIEGWEEIDLSND